MAGLVATATLLRHPFWRSPADVFSSPLSHIRILRVPPSPRRCPRVFSSTSFPSIVDVRNDAGDKDRCDVEDDLESDETEQIPAVEDDAPVVHTMPKLQSPKLSPAEKKELRSVALGLGKKLKSQQVGKSGVTPSVAAALSETLEANELLKLKVHGSCPGELPDVIQQLEESTGSVAVGQIGRSVILYKPSLSKMKKREAQVANERRKKSAYNIDAERRGRQPKIPFQATR